ncbi:hypothetical protein BXZ70DRAFT_65971 [Cristinia sonorae]|uniref:Uncharacterized protein n=1 Tax=Cristinia sonorae TaxID=1940300 RepID=A0A8K0USG3_9AGAR|nr:hypothetical protein BXZ70DRAFT_65971 [Cristinia sonorae]
MATIPKRSSNPMFFLGHQDDDYPPLPSHTVDAGGASVAKRTSFTQRVRSCRRTLLSSRRNKGITVLSLFVFAVLLCFFIPRSWTLFLHSSNSLPPLYEEYHARELALPQHNPDLPLPEGRNGKYLFVASHFDEYGWGNVMQEHLFDAFLAHKAGFGFVFDNYTWSRRGPEYSVYRDRVVIPSRIPFSAMLAGPIVGEPFPEGDPTPRAIRQEYFAEICPNPVKLQGKEITDQYVWGSTSTLIKKWIEKFESVGSNCIEIAEGSGQPFTLWTFGMMNVMDAWSDFVASPIIQQFRWSHLIESGFSRNLPLISSGPPARSFPYTPIPGLLVLQLRRGDYAEHCYNLLNWGSEWQAFNRFSQFPDQFKLAPRPESGPIPESSTVEHMKHCYPTPAEIAFRVEQILQSEEGKSLTDIYLMTNGKADFIAEVKQEVSRVHAWKSIKSSRDLVVDREQQYVKQAIDMLIGLRSDVIVANGWSSMSSNVAMLRMALYPEHSAKRTRYW